MVTAERPTYLSKTLTQLREANCLTQGEVAEKIGLTRSAYSYYELGKAEPSTDTLIKLARLFGAQVEDFFPSERDAYSFSDSKFPNSSEPRPTKMGNLSTEERQLIALFRISNKKEKKKVVDFLSKEAKNGINNIDDN